MPYAWKEHISGIPDTWWEHRGRGVKVALLDTGVHLWHPWLKHLTTAGRRFDATRLAANDAGQHDVDDLGIYGQPHGTLLAGILAGYGEGENGYIGLSPGVDLYIYRVTRLVGGRINVWQPYVAALRHAVEEIDADIIFTGVLPILTDAFRRDPNKKAVDELFGQLAEKNILLFSPLQNTDHFIRLNDLNHIYFPSNRREAITAGILTNKMLAGLPEDCKFSDYVHFLLPERPLEVCDVWKGEACISEINASSSLASAILAGVASLLLAQARAAAGEPYLRFSREEAVARLRAVGTTFDEFLATGYRDWRLMYGADKNLV